MNSLTQMNGTCHSMIILMPGSHVLSPVLMHYSLLYLDIRLVKNDCSALPHSSISVSFDDSAEGSTGIPEITL